MRELRLLRDPKRLIPILLGSVAGVLVLASLLFPQQSAAVQSSSTELLRWVTVVAAFALLVGVTNVVVQHLRRVIKQEAQWGYSIPLLIGVIIPPLIAFYGYLSEGQTSATSSALFQDMIQWVYTPLSVSLLALLTFFAITATIHAIGSGNREAMVVIGVALVMLLAQLPLLATVPYLGATINWIQNYVALAGLRGLVFGASIGAIVASVRILLGLDRPYLDR
jgi:hypothetical protein